MLKTDRKTMGEIGHSLSSSTGLVRITAQYRLVVARGLAPPAAVLRAGSTKADLRAAPRSTEFDFPAVPGSSRARE